MAGTARITHLPLELVQKVATLCEPSDLAALGVTCRQLHSVCTDTLVLREIFLRLSHVADKNTLRKLLVDRLSNNDPAQANAIWALLARAASQAPLLIDELETELLPYESVPWDNSHPRPHPAGGPLRNILGVLSTLTILGRM